MFSMSAFGKRRKERRKKWSGARGDKKERKKR